MKTAIIIGATSGIGESLAKQMAVEGYRLGLTGRRIHKLVELQKSLPTDVHIAEMDVCLPNAQEICTALWDRLGVVDVFVYCSGTGYESGTLLWENEKETIGVNALGFAALANIAYHRFQRAESGHIVAISSVAANVASGFAPAYNASKAFVANYVKGLRAHAHQHSYAIVFTDVQPGFVDTAMAKSKKKFWVASPRVAAIQILNAIKRKKALVYVTRRWRYIAWIFRLLPEPIARRML